MKVLYKAKHPQFPVHTNSSTNSKIKGKENHGKLLMNYKLGKPF